MSKVRAADAHDAGFVGGFVSKESPADAYDAGCLMALCPKKAQLMVMMLAVWWF